LPKRLAISANRRTSTERSAPHYSAAAGLLGTGVAIFGFIALGFLSDAIGRKPTAMLYYAMCLILTPVVCLWAKGMGPLLVAVTVFGFFTGGIRAWAPIWLPELFPTRMRGTAVAFCFNAPRWISCVGPLIARTLIVALGGYGAAATVVGLFFILGVVAAPLSARDPRQAVARDLGGGGGPGGAGANGVASQPGRIRSGWCRRTVRRPRL
jgi:MFS family permease